LKLLALKCLYIYIHTLERETSEYFPLKKQLFVKRK